MIPFYLQVVSLVFQAVGTGVVFYGVRGKLSTGARFLYWLFAGHSLLLLILRTLRGTALDAPTSNIDQRLFAAFLGLAIVWLFVLSGRKVPGLKLSSVYEHGLVLTVMLSVIGILVGIVSGNSLKYVVSDTYTFAAFGVVYFLSLASVSRKEVMLLLTALYKLAAILLIGSLIIQVGNLLLGSLQDTGVAARYVLPILFMSFMMPNEQTAQRIFSSSKRYRYSLLFGALLNVFLSFSRGEWIVTAAGMFLAVLLSYPSSSKFGRFRRAIQGVWIILAILVVVQVGFSFTPQSTTISRLGFYTRSKFVALTNDLVRLQAVQKDNAIASGSLDQKVAETLDVQHYMATEGNILTYIVGFGNGAEFLAQRAKVVSPGTKGIGYVHNIHNMMYAKMFRYGLVGLIVALTVLVGMPLAFLRRKHTLAYSEQFLINAAVVVFVMTAIKQLSVDYVFWDVGLAIFMALHAVLFRDNALKFKLRI